MAVSVHLSAGFYANEVDYSHYASRVGKIHIALPGYTKQGPAGTNTNGKHLISNTDEYEKYYGNISVDYPLTMTLKETAPWCNNFILSRVLGQQGYNHTNIRTWPIFLSGGSGALYNVHTVGFLKSRQENSAVTTAVTYHHDSTGLYTLDIHKGDGTVYSSFTFSINETDSHFVEDIFGTSPNDTKNDYLYCWKVFPNIITQLSYSAGTFSGLNNILVSGGIAASYFNNHAVAYQAARTPWILGKQVGGTAKRLCRFISRSDGKNSNEIVKIQFENIDTTNKTFDVVLRKFIDSNSSPTRYERFRNCSFDSTSTSYIKKKIGDGDEYPIISDFIYIEMHSEVSDGDYPCGFMGLPIISGTGIYSGYAQTIMSTGYTTATTIAKQMLGVDNSYIDEQKLSYFPSATTDTFNIREKGFHLDSGMSSSIYFKTSSAITSIGKTSAKFMTLFYGGFDGFDEFSTESYTNAVGQWTTDFNAAVNILSNPEEYNIDLICTPDTSINITDALPVITNVLDIIEPPDGRSDCFYLIQPDDDRTVTDIVNSLEGADLDTSWAAIHWPWIKIYDEQNVKYLWTPPTPMVARSIAKTWSEKFPWWAPAGLKRGTAEFVKDVRVVLKKADRDTLYVNRINPIQKFGVEGTIAVWGQKTLQKEETSLDRINVRLGLNWAKKMVAGATKYLIFDPSDQFYWDEFVTLVQPHLTKMKEERGLYDFRIIMDKNTNTPDIVDRNQVYGKILMKPTKSGEDLTVDFTLLASGAQFSEYA